MLIFILANMTACKKLLEPEVSHTAVAETAWRSPADVQYEVAGGYALLRDATIANEYTNLLFAAGDIRSGDFSNERKPEWNSRTNTKQSLFTISDWRPFYMAIAQFNLILDHIGDVPAASWKPQEKERLLGETKFLRGLTFFIMARMWREFPLPLHSMDFSELPREKESTIFEVIFDDLNTAIQLLDWTYTQDEKTVRATKGSAMAMMAHSKAWMHEYATAEKYCDSVIRNGGYKLMENREGLQKIFIGKSAEGIFELNFSYDQHELAPNATPASVTMGRPYYLNSSVFTLPGYESQSEGRWDDVRSEFFQYGTGNKDLRYTEWFLPGSWEVYEEDATPWLGKFRHLREGADTASRNINECNYIITRLADIILLHAETLEALGRRTEAIDELNKIRRRSNKDTYKPAEVLKDAILNERRIELCGEGHRFFDLVRTRQLPRFQRNITRADWFESNLWTVPVLDTYITQSNSNISQYPIWK